MPYFKKYIQEEKIDIVALVSPVNQSKNKNPLFEAFINASSEAGHVNPDMNGEFQEGFGMFDTTIIKVKEQCCKTLSEPKKKS